MLEELVCALAPELPEDCAPLVLLLDFVEEVPELFSDSVKMERRFFDELASSGFTLKLSAIQLVATSIDSRSSAGSVPSSILVFKKLMTDSARRFRAPWSAFVVYECSSAK